MKRAWFYRILFYALSQVILAAGVTLNTKTVLGVSPIVSMPFSIAQIFGLNFAWTTFAVYTLLVLLQFPLRGKNRLWSDLLQIPFSLIFSAFLELFDRLFAFGELLMWQRLVMLAVAIILTAIGAAMMVNMRLVPNPADGLASAVGDALHRGMGFGKNVIDLISVCITCLIGLIFAHKIIGLGIGTVAAMILTSRCIALFNHFCKAKMQPLSGCAESVLP